MRQAISRTSAAPYTLMKPLCAKPRMFLIFFTLPCLTSLGYLAFYKECFLYLIHAGHRGFLKSALLFWCTVFFVATWMLCPTQQLPPDSVSACICIHVCRSMQWGSQLPAVEGTMHSSGLKNFAGRRSLEDLYDAGTFHNFQFSEAWASLVTLISADESNKLTEFPQKFFLGSWFLWLWDDHETRSWWEIG